MRTCQQCAYWVHCKDTWIYKGCLQKSGILLDLKVFLWNFPIEQAILRKSKAPRKSPEKWSFLSLAFYNAPSLHIVEHVQFL